ncbi:MAG: 23S rRNA (uracil(1939)-C(5))-methyltransferase RlmD [Eubacterium sp.]
MDIKKNDDIKLNIEAMTSEGSAIGHYNGIAVFVRGAVPNDVIIAHIIKVAKNYAIGTVKEIITYSPSRITSNCSVSKRCGGCSFRDMTYEEELKYKKSRVQDAVTRIGHLDIQVDDVIGADKIDNYRNKAQYPVIINDGELYAGFYAYKSHRIIPCNNCLLQPKEFEDCLNAFSKWVEQSAVTSYDESTGKGLLRHIYLRKAFATNEIMACAVINGTNIPNEALLIQLLCLIDGIKTICLNINREKGNVVLGKDTRVLWGSETITDVLLGKRFIISPNSFYQVNHDQCEALYLKAREYAGLTGNETVVDLYCGAGTIGLTMADKAKKIFGVEIVPQAIENAKENAKINGIDNAGFFCGDAYDAVLELESRGIKPDVVILDPPRKGCQRELFDVIQRMNPKRIVYVSCDSATLARDLEILKDKGYQTQRVTPVDMFPRTPHVEAVAMISRSNSK